MAERIFETGQGRVWLQKYGPRPDQNYEMLGCAKVGGLTIAEADVTRVRCPDPNAYGQFIDVGEIIGAAKDLPKTTLLSRLGLSNYILRLKCSFDLQVLYGQCKHPGDRVRGWEKILHINRARFTGRSSDDLTAMTDTEQNPVMLTGDVTAGDIWEIDPLSWTEKAAYAVTTQIMDIAICDRQSCGECGGVSDGCQRIYALAAAPGAGSPAIIPEVAYSEDGGVNWLDEYIDTLTAAQQPTAIGCVGDYVVVVSNAVVGLNYADKASMGTWTQQATGFVATKYPRCIAVLDPSHVWIGAAGGYVYFANDITSGVTPQAVGVTTTQNLNQIRALNSEFVVAVGDANAIIYTDDGGTTWTAVTGPAPGVNLLALWVSSHDIWWVGTDNIGKLFYTKDRGVTWVEKPFPYSGVAGDIRDIVFTDDPAVGYLAVALATPAGQICRTIDGGSTWYKCPEQQGASLPASDAINALAPCGTNTVWAGGLADNGADGIVLNGVGY